MVVEQMRVGFCCDRASMVVQNSDGGQDEILDRASMVVQNSDGGQDEILDSSGSADSGGLNVAGTKPFPGKYGGRCGTVVCVPGTN